MIRNVSQIVVLSKQAYKKLYLSEGLGLLENIWFRDLESNQQLKQRLLLKDFQAAGPAEFFATNVVPFLILVLFAVGQPL